MELTWRGTDPPADRNAVRTSADVNFGVRAFPLRCARANDAPSGRALRAAERR